MLAAGARTTLGPIEDFTQLIEAIAKIVKFKHIVTEDIFINKVDIIVAS